MLVVWCPNPNSGGYTHPSTVLCAPTAWMLAGWWTVIYRRRSSQGHHCHQEQCGCSSSSRGGGELIKVYSTHQSTTHNSTVATRRRVGTTALDVRKESVAFPGLSLYTRFVTVWKKNYSGCDVHVYTSTFIRLASPPSLSFFFQLFQFLCYF